MQKSESILLQIVKLPYRRLKQFSRCIRRPFLNWICFFKLNKLLRELKISASLNKTIFFYHCSFFDFHGQDFLAGGAERYAIDLAKLLEKRGFKSVLFQKSEKNLWHKTFKHLKVIGVPINGNHLFYDFCIRCLSTRVKLSILSWSATTPKIKNSCDHILFVGHGVFWDNITIAPNIKALGNTFKRMSNFISVDANMLSWFRSTFPTEVYKKNVTYIPNYVDTAKFHPNSSKRNTTTIKILFPRRITHYRGYWLVTAILEDILANYPQVNFEFVGIVNDDEDIEKDLSNLIKKIPTRITHYTLNPDEMHMAYQSADISLIPTVYSEGTSLACLEAMSCANAVIATNIGGLANLIINNYNGLLINPNSDELKFAIVRLIEDENLRKRLGQNARHMAVEAFNKEIWENSWSKIIDRQLT